MKYAWPETGTRFGRWTVIGRVDPPPNHPGHRYLVCRCDCDQARRVFLPNLFRGLSLSCGCAKTLTNKTYGRSHTPEYESWAGMIRRCHRPRTKNYSRYGGRGIIVCARWRESFDLFLSDMGPRPSAQHSIERRDNEWHYQPDNCYWATRIQQANNKHNTCRLTMDGITRTVGEWSRITGMRQQIIHGRLRNGWSDVRALTEPLHSRPKLEKMS